MFRDWLHEPVLTLLRRIAMDNAQLAAALGDVSTSLEAVSDQLTKATTEIVAAIANSGNSTPAVDAAVAKLQSVSGALAKTSQSLDNLNADLPPDTPVPTP